MTLSPTRWLVAIFLLTPALFAAPLIVSDFGLVSVSANTIQSVNIPLPVAELSQALTCQLHYGVDFSASACSTTATGVTLSIKFTPKYPGLRQDAVIITTSTGSLVAEAFIHGRGDGPLAAFRPGVIRPLLASPENSGTPQVSDPFGIVADLETGVAYIADRQQNVVWRFNPADGSQTIVAGVPGLNIFGTNSGDGGLATAAVLFPHSALALDSAGNLFIASSTVIRRVDSVTGIISTYAGGGSDPDGDGGPATSASFTSLTGLATDTAGNLYICDGHIRKVDAITGILSTVAGSNSLSAQYGDGGPAIDANLKGNEVAVDSLGNLYITSYSWYTVRRVDAVTGIITTVAGIPNTQGSTNPDGVPATSVGLDNPSGLAIDAAGNVYFGNQNFVRKVSASTGIITSLNDGTSSLVSSSSITFTSLNGYPANEGVYTGFFSMDGAGNLFTPAMEIQRNQGTLFFAQTSVGQTSSAQNFTVENIGTQPLQVAGNQISPNFTLTGGCSGAITTGQECSTSIAFQPTHGGGISGNITTTDNSLNQAAIRQISVLRSPWSQVVPNVTTVDFGSLIYALSSSDPFTLFLVNRGDRAVRLTTTFSGPNTSDFSLNENDHCGLVAGTGSIAPQQACGSWIVFQPQTAGLKTATLTIANDFDSSVQTITLTGVALAPSVPVLTLSQSSISFNAPQWNFGGMQTLTLTNTGNGVLTSNFALQNVTVNDYFFPPLSCRYINPGSSCQLDVSFTPRAAGSYNGSLVIIDNASNSPRIVPLTGTSLALPLQFIPLTPCRIADTRNLVGPFGGPLMDGNSFRSFRVPDSSCGVPAAAVAYSLNVTAVPVSELGYLTMVPDGAPFPMISTLNSDGRTKANAAIVAAGTGGVSLYVTNPTHVILDVNGYFVPAGTNANALTFHPVAPCRIADTRKPSGQLGGPYLSGGVARTFPILNSTCELPASAQAYSLNLTAIPHTVLGYLSTWPTGQPKPLVSTLNSPGDVTANAAIVPAGTGGSIDVYATNDADLVIDVNGYFAPADTGGLSFYPMPPCRPLDTRQVGNGLPFSGSMVANISTGCNLPSSTQAFALNATVVPPGQLGFLTLWPDGTSMPLASTLNSEDGSIKSNLAIVPTTNGQIDAFSTNFTQLILDISGYFAP